MSTAGYHRHSTVWDLAALRLHPNGTCVSQDSSKNATKRYAANVAQDLMGNWFATDACGPWKVSKFYTPGLNDGTPGEAGFRVRKRKTHAKTRDPRATKRQKFYKDWGFLENPSFLASPHKSLPDSDLIKCLHYMAAKHYDEQGQLFNAGLRYRQMRKQLRELRKEEQAARVAAGIVEPMLPVRRGGRIKGMGKVQYPKDMYQVMTGTAIVAIAMLLEEWVMKLLEPHISQHWEEAMQEEASDCEEEGELDVVDSDHSEEDGRTR